MLYIAAQPHGVYKQYMHLSGDSARLTHMPLDCVRASILGLSISMNSIIINEEIKVINNNILS